MNTIENIWFVLVVLTLLVIAIAWIWLAVRAFQQHWAWGIAVIVVPVAQPVFAMLHWNRARRPFLLGVVAAVVLFAELLITRGYQAVFGA